jgi:hypothetical protein
LFTKRKYWIVDPLSIYVLKPVLFSFYNFIFTFYGGRGESAEHAEKVPAPYPIVSCQIMSDFTLFTVKFFVVPSTHSYMEQERSKKKTMLAFVGISLLSQPPYLLVFLLSVCAR